MSTDGKGRAKIQLSREHVCGLAGAAPSRELAVSCVLFGWGNQNLNKNFVFPERQLEKCNGYDFINAAGRMESSELPLQGETRS